MISTDQEIGRKCGANWAFRSCRSSHRIDIPSIRLQPGDTLKLRPHSAQTVYFRKLDDTSPAPAEVPGWLKVDRKKVVVTVGSVPARDDAEVDINEQLIVEYYSR